MSASASAQSVSDFQAVFTASCTLIGVIAGAIFANWQNIFRKDKVVQAPVLDYVPSDNFETEVRVMLENTGQRAVIEDAVDRIFSQLQTSMVARFPESENEVKFAMGIYKEEMPNYDDFIKEIIPVWEKYYTTSTIQELNKFYSTKTMRDFVSKNKHVSDDYWPRAQALAAQAEERAQKRLEQAYDPVIITPPDRRLA